MTMTVLYSGGPWFSREVDGESLFEVNHHGVRQVHERDAYDIILQNMTSMLLHSEFVLITLTMSDVTLGCFISRVNSSIFHVLYFDIFNSILTEKSDKKRKKSQICIVSIFELWERRPSSCSKQRRGTAK